MKTNTCPRPWAPPRPVAPADRTAGRPPSPGPLYRWRIDRRCVAGGYWKPCPPKRRRPVDDRLHWWRRDARCRGGGYWVRTPRRDVFTCRLDAPAGRHAAAVTTLVELEPDRRAADPARAVAAADVLAVLSAGLPPSTAAALAHAWTGGELAGDVAADLRRRFTRDALAGLLAGKEARHG